MELIEKLSAAYAAWKEKRRNAKADRAYRRGYEWATAELETGTSNPFDIEVYYGSGIDPTQFDIGARDATDAWCKLNPDDDDRIFNYHGRNGTGIVSNF